MRPIQLYHPSKSLNAHACSCMLMQCFCLQQVKHHSEVHWMFFDSIKGSNININTLWWIHIPYGSNHTCWAKKMGNAYWRAIWPFQEISWSIGIDICHNVELHGIQEGTGLFHQASGRARSVWMAMLKVFGLCYDHQFSEIKPQWNG